MIASQPVCIFTLRFVSSVFVIVALHSILLMSVPQGRFCCVSLLGFGVSPIRKSRIKMQNQDVSVQVSGIVFVNLHDNVQNHVFNVMVSLLQNAIALPHTANATAFLLPE